MWARIVAALLAVISWQARSSRLGGPVVPVWTWFLSHIEKTGGAGGAPLLALSEKWAATQSAVRVSLSLTSSHDRAKNQKPRWPIQACLGLSGVPGTLLAPRLPDLKPTKNVVTYILATIPAPRETTIRARGAMGAQHSVQVADAGSSPAGSILPVLCRRSSN